MHSLSAFMVWYQHGSKFIGLGINQGLHSVSYWIKRMENIEEGRASRQTKVLSEIIDAADGNKHANRTAKSEKGAWMKIELRIVNERLTGSRRAHYIADSLAKASFQNRSGHWLDGLDCILQ